MILEYKMDRNSKKELHTPLWIECGGFLQNPTNKTLLGFSPSVREYKIPDAALILTIDQAIERSLDIHAGTPYRKINGQQMTADDVTEMVLNIISSNDML